MGIFTWTGSIDGDYSDANNWSPAGGPPGTGDSAIVDDASTQDMDSGFAQAAQLLDLLWLLPGSTISIGSSGNELNIGASRVLHQGSGSLWFTSANTGTDTDLIIIDSSNTSNAATIDAAASSGVTEVQVVSGNVTLTGSVLALTTLAIGESGTNGNNAVVTLSASAGTTTTVVMSAGFLTASSTITTGIMAGRARWTQSAAAITNLRQEGGRCADILAGIYDASQDHRAITITTLRVHPGAVAYAPRDRCTVTNNRSLPGSKFIDDTVSPEAAEQNQPVGGPQ
jgi:hypothetical protein